MDLSGSNLTPASFRELLNCFNALGALDPIAKMVARLSDPQLQPLVDVVNNHLLGNHARMYELQQTYDTMKASGELDTMLAEIANVLSPQYQAMLTSGIEVARESYYVSQSSLFHSAQPDQTLLGAMAKIAPKITPDNVSELLQWGLTYTKSRAFADVQTKFGPRQGSRDLQTLTTGMLAYMAGAGQNGHYDAGQALIQGVGRGDLLQAFDDLGGTTPSTITAQLSSITSIFKTSLQNNATIGDGLSSLFHALNVPIACLQGAQQVPNGNLNVINELVGADVTDPSDFIRKNEMMTLIVMEPFCTYPAGLSQYIGSMIDFANYNSFLPSTQMMKEFARWTNPGTVGPSNSPLIQMLIGMIGDTGGDNASGLKYALPALAEINDRGAIDDLILLLLLPGTQDRADLESAATYMTQSWPDLGGKSIYNAFQGTLSRISPTSAYALINTIAPITQSPQPLLDPLVSMARDVYYVNDAHPFVGLLQDIAADGVNDGGLFDTMFQMSQMPEFVASLNLTAAMATDGRLSELMGSLLQIFYPWSVQGTHPVNPTTEPTFQTLARHDLVGTDLTPYAIVSSPLPASDPCSQLSVGFNIADYQASTYDTNLDALTSCLQTTENVAGLLSMVEYLRDLKIPGTSLDYFTLQIQMLQQLNLDLAATQYLSNAWITSFDSGQFNHLLDLLPMAVTTSYGTGSNQGDLLQPLVNLLASIYSGSVLPALRDLETFGAGVIQQSNAPSLILFGDNLYNADLEPITVPSATPQDMTRLTRWVGNKECDRFGAATGATLAAEEEAQAEIDAQNFDLAVNNEDIDNINGTLRAREQYTVADFMSMANPILDRLRTPSESDPNYPALNAVLNIMKYFTLTEGEQPSQGKHYTPDYLLKWLHDRSIDQHLITYFYHTGTASYETTPRVKIVNTLDRLELTLIDADFTQPFPLLANSALQFAQEIGEAWGDEPREIWPPEIQAEFPPGTSPKTLAQVYEDMHSTQSTFENIMGLPTLDCKQVHDPNDPDDIPDPKNTDGFALPNWIPGVPNLKRTLWNLAEVLPAIEENLPLTAAERLDPDIWQKKPFGDGLKVLRDMFFEINNSSKRENQSDTAGWSNNLKIVTQLTRMGLLHMVGEKVRKIPEGTAEWAALQDAMRAVVWGGASPALPNVVGSILTEEGPVSATQNLWLSDVALEQIVGLVDSGGSPVMGQLAFYTLADTQQMNLVADGVNALQGVFEGNGKLFVEHPDWINNLLTSTQASNMARMLYESDDTTNKAGLAAVLKSAFAVDAGTSNAPHVRNVMTIVNAFFGSTANQNLWNSFSDRWDSMKASVDYQAREPDISLFTNSALHLIEERPDMMATPGALDASERLRAYTGQLLLNGTIDDYLALMKDNPTQFYQLLQLLATNEGKLEQFFDMARTSLAGPPSATPAPTPSATPLTSTH
jgi:hypothetical protein